VEKRGEEITLLKIGNTFGQAAQIPTEDEKGRIDGTVYTYFIDITEITFFLSYKVNNNKVIKLDLNVEFKKSRSQKINLNKL